MEISRYGLACLYYLFTTLSKMTRTSLSTNFPCWVKRQPCKLYFKHRRILLYAWDSVSTVRSTVIIINCAQAHYTVLAMSNLLRGETPFADCFVQFTTRRLLILLKLFQGLIVMFSVP